MNDGGPRSPSIECLTAAHWLRGDRTLHQDAYLMVDNTIVKVLAFAVSDARSTRGIGDQRSAGLA